MHRVIRFRFPSTSRVTGWIFGTQRRLVRRLEWLTLCPNWGNFPHISHFNVASPLIDNQIWGRMLIRILSYPSELGKGGTG